MCTEQITVVGLDDERTAYEVEQYLKGLQQFENVSVDMLSNSVTVEYDETAVKRDRVLTEIEHAGCIPSENCSVFSKVRHRLIG